MSRGIRGFNLGPPSPQQGTFWNSSKRQTIKIIAASPLAPATCHLSLAIKYTTLCGKYRINTHSKYRVYPEYSDPWEQRLHMSTWNCEVAYSRSSNSSVGTWWSINYTVFGIRFLYYGSVEFMGSVVWSGGTGFSFSRLLMQSDRRQIESGV